MRASLTENLPTYGINMLDRPKYAAIEANKIILSGNKLTLKMKFIITHYLEFAKFFFRQIFVVLFSEIRKIFNSKNK